MTMPDPAASSGTKSVELAEIIRRVKIILGMIKFSHTIFALPFALLSMFIAAQGWPSAWQFFWIVAACVFARSAAMAYNRLHDEPYDKQNPRTQNWALPAGILSRGYVLKFWIACSLGFVFAAWMLNMTAFCLSFVALAVLFGYSITKRYTSGTHFFLGLALAIAPVGAWIAIRGEFAWIPILLSLAVLFWVAGFDIIYSCQDVEVDKKLGLHSLPVKLGKPRALAISAACHAASIFMFFVVWYSSNLLGGFYLTALAVCAGLLAYEQSIISPDDLSRLDQAFFTLNGWVSMALFLGGVSDVFRYN